MAEASVASHELPNIVTIISEHFKDIPVLRNLSHYENVIFSLIVIAAISLITIVASRRLRMIPGRLQSAFEMFVGGFDSFICGILGPKGRRFTPFIGTLFIYILSMNLISLVPFMKAPTSNWSVTLALALCVFVYLQYTTLKELGLLGFVDHLMGKPRGILAASVVIPLLMLFLHIISELVRPISLSLRLRSNIWGDDMLLAVLAGFGLKGVPLLLFNMFIAALAAVVQASVFCLLTTIYFALALTREEKADIRDIGT
ncbi:MAG: F0F1 ATP synthase subunit A [Candidatus Omnitrophica bacterium]|nr:F0F1 ATP synthase subunit A [Candidatus Omnitrophota bacterium]